MPPDGYRVLVIDKGSSDDIGGVCRSFIRVRYLTEPRPGSYAARNTGVDGADADAEILPFTDSDWTGSRPAWLA